MCIRDRCDSPFTKEGIQQIEKMTQLLKDEKITKAYTSPTLRAKQTAQIILKEHDVLLHEDERLKEVNFGVLEGLPCSFVDTLHLESPSWLDDLEMDYTSYQGENIDDVIIRQQKVLKEIEKISNEEDCIVVVGQDVYKRQLIWSNAQEPTSFEFSSLVNHRG